MSAVELRIVACPNDLRKDKRWEFDGAVERVRRRLRLLRLIKQIDTYGLSRDCDRQCLFVRIL